MRVSAGPGLVGRRVRRGAADALRISGRTALAVAELVSPTDDARRRALPGTAPSLRPAGPKDSRVDARSADMADLRRLAIEATIEAADDPSRPAYDRLTARTVNLSEWAAGRLLGEAERMRQSAVAAVAAGSGDGRLLARRQFDPALRRQFPGLDDVSSARLFDHGVLMARVISEDVAAPDEPSGSRGRLGALVGRLRSR